MTDADILAIRDRHLPSQGEAFDTLAFGRAVAAEAAARAVYKLLEDADTLAAYSRTDGRREWVNVGVWLRPGEVIAHMADPTSSNAPAPVGLPAGEQTGPVAGAPTRSGESKT